MSTIIDNTSQSKTQASTTRKKKFDWKKVGVYISALIILVWCIFPFYWMVVTSLRPVNFTFDTSLIPENVTFENYSAAMDMAPDSDQFPRAILNSLIIGTVVTLISLLVGMGAAYALTRLQFRGKFLILGFILGASMFPAVALLTPLYQIFNELGWMRTYQALIIPQISFVLPLTIYTLTSFFRELPWELEESARVDGATRFQAFTKVMLPLAAPAIFTTGLLAFLASWNEFIISNLLSGNDKSVRPVTVAIANFAGSNRMEDPWVSTMAAGAIICIPLVIIVLVFQRKIVNGLTAGALK